MQRTYATETDLPAVTATPSSSHINPNVAPHLYNIPRVLTTIHHWPSLEPQRYAWYDSKHLDVPLRKDLLHRAVIYEGDSHRQGTASTKWRDDVHGSGRKLRKQKGAGKARVGDKKSPTRVGGGVAHGPKPRDFSTGLQRKVYDRAWRTALSYRYRKGELLIVNGSLKLAEDQTAKFLDNMFTLNRMGQGFGRSMLVTRDKDEGLAEAMAQIGKHGTLKDVEDIDVKNLLETGRIIMEQKVLNALLLAHSSDLGEEYSLTHAVQLALEGRKHRFLYG